MNQALTNCDTIMDRTPTKSDIDKLLFRREKLMMLKNKIINSEKNAEMKTPEIGKRITVLSSIVIKSPDNEIIAPDYRDHAEPSNARLAVEDTAVIIRNAHDITYCPDAAIEEISSDMKDAGPTYEVLVKDPSIETKDTHDSTYCFDAALESITSDLKDASPCCGVEIKDSPILTRDVHGSATTYCSNANIEAIPSDVNDAGSSYEVLVKDPSIGIKDIHDSTYCFDAAIESITSDLKDTGSNCEVLIKDPPIEIRDNHDSASILCFDAVIEEISSDTKDAGPSYEVLVKDPSIGTKDIPDSTYCFDAALESMISDVKDAGPCGGVEIKDSPILTGNANTYSSDANIEAILSDVQDAASSYKGLVKKDPSIETKDIRDSTYCFDAAIESISSNLKDIGSNSKVPTENTTTGMKDVHDSDSTYCSDAAIEQNCKMLNAEAGCAALTIPAENRGETCAGDKPANQMRKRSFTSNFVKYCMDFKPQNDNNGDFSSGSSDLWSPKDSEYEFMSDKEEKKKKKRKKIAKKEELTPMPLKKIRRTNKEKIRKKHQSKGLEYETKTGNLKEARSMKSNPCQINKCCRKCYEITDERRRSLYEYFWNLDNQKKKEWIVQCAQRIPKKRKKTDAIESRRSFSFGYYINEGEGRRQVCQQFILKTLDISQTYILYNVQNSQEGISQSDQRKRYSANKYDEDTKTFAKNYIESLPVLPSHYNRKDSKKLYLPEEFKHISNLYRLYKKHCEKDSQAHLSERSFMILFNEYNISFHTPKKDKCKTCLRYANLEQKTEKDIEDYKQHAEEKEASYKRSEIHRNMVHKDNNTVLVSSFDLQKVLNTPHGESMLLYYCRKYAVFNLTVYESGTQNGYCYTWGESEGKRGSAEIGTCLYKYLTEVDKRGIKYLILYCDSCSGQNKNKVILSILNHFLKSSANLEVIQINYLIPGHTYMSVDSMHSVIEREVRKIIVWSPTQWATFMQAARKKPHPYKVEPLDHSDFIDWQQITNDTFSNKTASNKNLRIKDLRIVTFKKQNFNIMHVKYTMKEDGESYEISLGKEDEMINKKKGKGKGKGKGAQNLTQENVIADGCLPKLYKEKLPISRAKYKDLKKLCDDGTIPRMFQKDYLYLPHDDQIIDKISDTEIENESGEENQSASIACTKNDGKEISLMKRKKKEDAGKKVEDQIVIPRGGRGKGKRTGQGQGREK